MKNPWFSLSVISAAALVGMPLHAGSGAFDFGTFTPPGKGGEFVEVSLNGNLLNMAARLAAKDQPEAADLLKSIESIHVNVVSLDEGNRESTEKRIADIRSQLDGNGWEKNVAVRQNDDDVAVYTKLRGREAVEGLVVTVIENHKQAVLVNIVGDIRPEKIAMLGERLDIEPLKRLKNFGKKEDSGEKRERHETHDENSEK